MIRLIVQIQNCCDAAHVSGAKPTQHFKTFDIEHAELERMLWPEKPTYDTCWVIGAEVVKPATEEPPC